MPDLDDADRRLLAALQADGKLSMADLAAAAGLSVSPAWRRVKRMQEAGVIQGYVALLDRKVLGLDALAYVHVSLIDHTEATIAAFDRMVQTEAQIVECASITGDADFILKVVAETPEALERILMRRILGSGLVRHSRSNFVMRRTKATTAWPLGPFV